MAELDLEAIERRQAAAQSSTGTKALLIQTFSEDLPALIAEVRRLREDVEAGQQLTGSFFEALKPLNLQMINVADPGAHVTALIVERDVAEAEVARLREPFAVAWPPRDVVAELVTWTEHLWGLHDCDHQGYEAAIAACDAAKAWLLSQHGDTAKEPA